MTAPRIMVTHPWAERKTSTVLKTRAKAIFSLITRRALRERRIAVGIFSSSSVINAMSAVSMATSVPAAPMAMPTSAAASAGASLTPSPTMATVWPCFFHSFTLNTFSSGRRFASYRIPNSFPIWLAIASLSPVSIQISDSPSFLILSMVAFAFSLNVSAMEISPRR